MSVDPNYVARCEVRELTGALPYKYWFRPSTGLSRSPHLNMETENISYDSLSNWSISQSFWSQENTNYVGEYFDKLDLESLEKEVAGDQASSEDGNNNLTKSTFKLEAVGKHKSPKRLSANARERRRMNRINCGYDKLRRVLPGTNEKLSKMEALQAAQHYILYLHKLLE